MLPGRYIKLERRDECECEHCGAPLIVGDEVWEDTDRQPGLFCGERCGRAALRERDTLPSPRRLLAAELAVAPAPLAILGQGTSRTTIPAE